MAITPIEEKRIFLLVSPHQAKLDWMSAKIAQHITNATLFQAEDGITALSKFDNARPHVLITEIEIPKIDGLRVVDKVLAAKGSDLTAVIISGHPPIEERHLDEVTTGRVQYWFGDKDEKELMTCVNKALNYSSHQANTEFHVRFLGKGDVLMNEGDKVDNIYFVKKGQLRASKTTEGKSDVMLGTIEYGEFVGEMAYINGEARNASVMALTDCELIEVPVGHFESILFKRPSWSKALMLTLCKRVKRANQAKT